MQKFEEMQYGQGFGIYGRKFRKDDVYNETDYKIAYSMANDKHLLEKLKRSGDIYSPKPRFISRI